tara:strand:+ start:592 stop:840 length:249 start_codon:yes stop_codon:yes gene_type:complete
VVEEAVLLLSGLAVHILAITRWVTVGVEEPLLITLVTDAVAAVVALEDTLGQAAKVGALAPQQPLVLAVVEEVVVKDRPDLA